MVGTASLGIILRQLVDIAIQIYIWLIIVRVVLSWIPVSGPSLRPFLVFIYEITEPFLAFFRRIIPATAAGGVGIDFSPIIAILVLQFLAEPLVTKVIELVFQ